jgi:multidrug resistance efflux pump
MDIIRPPYKLHVITIIIIIIIIIIILSYWTVLKALLILTRAANVVIQFSKVTKQGS